MKIVVGCHAHRLVMLGFALAIVAPPLAGQDVRLAGEAYGTPLPEWMDTLLAEDPNTFEVDRGWRSRLLAAYATRVELFDRGVNPDTLGPSRAAALGAAVSGIMRIPVIPVLFENRTTRPAAASRLAGILFGAGSDDLTLASYYREVSRGQLVVEGDVLDWVQLGQADTHYENGENGRPPGLGLLLKEALDSADAKIDFSRYDRDGDGYVDMVSIVHAETGGECSRGSENIWSQRWNFGAAINVADSVYETQDGVFVSDFVVQPGQGCDGGEPTIGVFAHELGHVLGLPDLYAVSRGVPPNSGIAEWGLMGTGAYNLPSSPAHMSAWSKVELGWMPIEHVTETRDVRIGPAARGGSAIRVDIPRSGEYFLLENRQPTGSDKHLVRDGLLIWHVDEDVIRSRPFAVQNETQRKGVDLEEADGDGDLDRPSRHADSGDPFPGATDAISFGPDTRPSSNANNDAESGIRIEDIRRRGDDIAAWISLDEPSVPFIWSPDSTLMRTESRDFGVLASLAFDSDLTLSDWQWVRSIGGEIVGASVDGGTVAAWLPLLITTDILAGYQRLDLERTSFQQR